MNTYNKAKNIIRMIHFYSLISYLIFSNILLTAKSKSADVSEKIVPHSPFSFFLVENKLNYIRAKFKGKWIIFTDFREGTESAPPPSITEPKKAQ